MGAGDDQFDAIQAAPVARHLRLATFEASSVNKNPHAVVAGCWQVAPNRHPDCHRTRWQRAI